MKEYIYLELLKEISNTEGNAISLNESLMVWGNHDFLKITKCDKSEKEPIFWLKQQYGNNHSSTYEGVEHQPLFLVDETKYIDNDLVSDLITLQTCDFEKSEKSIYVLSLLQLDYFFKTPNLKEQSANNLIKRINNLLKTYFLKKFPNNETFAQVMLNLGESDVAILFKTNNIETVASALVHLRKKFVVVKSYTLLILPYRYNDITNSEVKADLIKNLDIWLKRKDGTLYPLISNFVIDSKYQKILEKSSLTNDMRLLFGDYDVQLTTTASNLISSNLTISNSDGTYRYSKTSILMNNDSVSCYLPSEISENEKFKKEVESLRDAFVNVCTYLENTPNKEKWSSVIKSLKSSQNTCINLCNYFISLHETRYASDVYIHMQPIFDELTSVLTRLVSYCNHADNKERFENVIVQTEFHIKSLLKYIQEFLGIISLSTRTFSEAHGSYMRSANAALKLIEAYHSAVYLMHESTKCKLGNDPNNNFERNKCAILILPSRDASPMNKTMFTQLTPEHHISVIEANFDSLFHVRKMLFLIAHEVGHFSGNRERIKRQQLFNDAAIKYMLYTQLFENLLIWPHVTCVSGILENDSTNEEKNAIDTLDMDPSEKLNSIRIKCIKAIADIGHVISVYLHDKTSSSQKNLSVSVDSCRMTFKYSYLSDMIEETVLIFENEKDTIFQHDFFKCYLQRLSESLVSLYWQATDDISTNNLISDRTKWIIAARNIEENTKNKLNNVYVQLFDALDGAILRQTMINVTEPLFEDVYSDIYAIRLLHIEAKDYVEFLLTEEIKADSYHNRVFLMRFYTVLKVYYKVEDKYIIEMIKTYFEPEFANKIECLLSELIKMRLLTLSDVMTYAQLIIKNKPNLRKAILVRNFYKNPEENLYELWAKGLKRYNEI